MDKLRLLFTKKIYSRKVSVIGYRSIYIAKVDVFQSHGTYVTVSLANCIF